MSGGCGCGRLDKDFDEEEVWGAMKWKDGSSSNERRSHENISSTSKHMSSASMIISKANGGGGNRGFKNSAPVNIPEWSKVCKKGSTSWDDDDEDEEEWCPPHEWIAKKLARSQIGSFSVCEGVGRTLKGRDLTKVRNAVHTRTGFLE